METPIYRPFWTTTASTCTHCWICLRSIQSPSTWSGQSIIAKRGLTQFEDSVHGGFFSTTAEDPAILLRIKDEYDGAEPSGNSAAADALLRLAKLTGDAEYSDRAARAFAWLAKKVSQQPTTAPNLLAAVGRHLAEPEQTVLRYEVSTPAIEQVVLRYRQEFKPFGIVLALSDAAAGASGPTLPFLAALPRQGATHAVPLPQLRLRIARGAGVGFVCLRMREAVTRRRRPLIH